MRKEGGRIARWCRFIGLSEMGQLVMSMGRGQGWAQISVEPCRFPRLALPCLAHPVYGSTTFWTAPHSRCPQMVQMKPTPSHPAVFFVPVSCCRIESSLSSHCPHDTLSPNNLSSSRKNAPTALAFRKLPRSARAKQ